MMARLPTTPVEPAPVPGSSELPVNDGTILRLEPWGDEWTRPALGFYFTDYIIGRDYRRGRSRGEVESLTRGALALAIACGDLPQRAAFAGMWVWNVSHGERDTCCEYVIRVSHKDHELVPRLIEEIQRSLSFENAEWIAKNPTTGEFSRYFAYWVIGELYPPTRLRAPLKKEPAGQGGSDTSTAIAKE